jgi:hypothetical protein
MVDINDETMDVPLINDKLKASSLINDKLEASSLININKTMDGLDIKEK